MKFLSWFMIGCIAALTLVVATSFLVTSANAGTGMKKCSFATFYTMESNGSNPLAFQVRIKSWQTKPAECRAYKRKLSTHVRSSKTKGVLLDVTCGPCLEDVTTIKHVRTINHTQTVWEIAMRSQIIKTLNWLRQQKGKLGDEKTRD